MPLSEYWTRHAYRDGSHGMRPIPTALVSTSVVPRGPERARLSTIGAIGYGDRSRSVAAQEPGQADEPQEAEEAPVVEASSALGLGIIGFQCRAADPGAAAVVAVAIGHTAPSCSP
jgi:hypothetical protein